MFGFAITGPSAPPVTTIVVVGDASHFDTFSTQTTGSEDSAYGCFLFSSHAISVDREQALRELEALQSLRDGWDGDGAIPIHAAAIMAARVALDQLPASAPAPAVVPNVNGTVSLEWEIRDRYAHLEFSSSAYSLLLSRQGERLVGMKGPSHAPCGDIVRSIGAWLSECSPPSAAATQFTFSD